MKEIKFEDLYKVCSQKRDALIYGTGYASKYTDYSLNVLNQLLVLSFSTKYCPDKLPRVFILKRIMFQSEDIKKFLEELLDVTVNKIELLENNYVYGNTFRIFLEIDD